MKNIRSDSVGAFFSAYLWLKDAGNDYTYNNLKFLKDTGIPPSHHIYVSSSTSTVIALINKEDLKQIKSHPSFSDWSYYEFDEPMKNGEEIILEQIRADSISGTNSSYFNNGNGYTGNGIKVGIISAENLIFDSEALSLRDTAIAVLPSLLPPKKDPHPTAVISQIAGRRVDVGDVELMGVVREASVYFASTKTSKDLYKAIEEMVRQGVKIINYSAGIIKGDYSDIDRQIDRMIRSLGFLFITVSGNSRSMTSPGRAENAIAVGNAVTKNYPDIGLSPPWETWCFSEEDCSGFSNDGVHKPDLVAPGAWIGYAVNETNINYNNFGTSFACPWVSGIAVAIRQALGQEYSYLTIKAILLMSCNNDIISDNGNPSISEYVKLRSGYGMLNGTKAVEIAKKCRIYESRFDGEYFVDLERGEFEIMLTFEKSGDNVTLTLGNMVFSSEEQNTLLIKENSEGTIPLSVIGIGGGRFSLVIFRHT